MDELTKKQTNETVTPNTAPDVPEEVVNDVTPELADDVKVVQDTKDVVDTKPTNKKKSEQDVEFDKLVKETLAGIHGSGRERMINLGSHYAKVQQEVNRLTLNRSK